jgi:hypothetical protein
MTSRISLFSNQKANPNHPDLRGEIHLTVSMIQELAWYVNNNQRISPGYGQNPEPGVVLRLSCWGQQPDPQKPNGPVLTGSIESPAETDRRAQERAARQQQQPQGWGQQPMAPQPGYGQAPPPPYGQPSYPQQQPAPVLQPGYGQPGLQGGYGSMAQGALQPQQPAYPAPVPPPGPQPGYAQAPAPGPQPLPPPPGWAPPQQPII